MLVVTHLSAKARKFRLDVKKAVLEQCRWLPPLDGSIGVDIEICFERRGCDIDNRIKPILDALEHAKVIANDKFVDKLTVCRVPVTEKPGWCCVNVYRYKE